MSKMRSNIKLGYVVVLTILFVSAYLAVVLTLVGNWAKPALYDDIPDLIIFVIVVALFFKASTLQNPKTRKFIQIGAAIIAFQRMGRIPLQELDHVGVRIPFLWVVIWGLYFFGVLLILIGFRKKYD